MKVYEIMSREVAFLHPNNSVQEAAARMKELNVGYLPVIVNKQAVGFITEHHITVRIAALGLDPKTSMVEDAMTEGIFACNENDEIAEAAAQMIELQIQRLAVMDEEGKLTGIVSMDELAAHIDPRTVSQIITGLVRH